MMKNICLSVVLALMCVSVKAQDVNYEQRYRLLVSKLGPAGVGIETLLEKWAEKDSTDVALLTAKFNYHYNKAQTGKVVTKPQKTYLGMKPLLSLKDTTGADVYYYQEIFFDDEIYGRALKSADKAIACHPDNLDFRFLKANAYVAYEKDSPDMALAYLLKLAQEDVDRGGRWTFNGKEVGKGFVEDAMLEYCYNFYSTGTPRAMDAFLALSKKMLALHPDNLGYMNNVGAYQMVARQDYKAALKTYAKVLKKNPEDYTALKNSVIAARKAQNKKLEKKYMSRLQALEKK